jgi:hypothetical protein
LTPAATEAQILEDAGRPRAQGAALVPLVCCPACRTTPAVDLRTLDRHPWSAISSLIPALSCRGCRPHAKVGKDRVFLWDDALAGFGVAAFPSGTKVYVAQFRKDGRSRRIAIGEHGRLTPDEARSEAKRVH